MFLNFVSKSHANLPHPCLNQGWRGGDRPEIMIPNRFATDSASGLAQSSQPLVFLLAGNPKQQPG